MQIDSLISKWEARIKEYNAQMLQAKKINDFDAVNALAAKVSEAILCIEELKKEQARQSGKFLEPATLDSICHFKKHKGKKWKEVIEQDPGYCDWLLSKGDFSFHFDQTAHNYLVEVQSGHVTIYHDIRD